MRAPPADDRKASVIGTLGEARPLAVLSFCCIPLLESMQQTWTVIQQSGLITSDCG